MKDVQFSPKIEVAKPSKLFRKLDAFGTKMSKCLRKLDVCNGQDVANYGEISVQNPRTFGEIWPLLHLDYLLRAGGPGARNRQIRAGATGTVLSNDKDKYLYK